MFSFDCSIVCSMFSECLIDFSLSTCALAWLLGWLTDGLFGSLIGCLFDCLVDCLFDGSSNDCLVV